MKTVLDGINTFRAARGIRAVCMNTILNTIALEHAKRAYATGISDAIIDGIGPAQRATTAGYVWLKLGEINGFNLPSASAAVGAFTLGSATQPTVLGDYNNVGIGMLNQFWTLDFGSLKSGEDACTYDGTVLPPAPPAKTNYWIELSQSSYAVGTPVKFYTSVDAEASATAIILNVNQMDSNQYEEVLFVGSSCSANTQTGRMECFFYRRDLAVGSYNVYVFNSLVQLAASSSVFTVVSATCTPVCTGKTCGSDSCSGTCGTCASTQTCSSAGVCVCTPVCTGKTCGSDGCGGTCGTCSTGLTCSTAGTCACTPVCTGKTCGSDGCGGTCGTCSTGLTCSTAGTCACVASCTGKNCGSNGCGGTCGTCSSVQTCSSAGLCTCVPSCTGKTCGSDGCGGTCGTCTSSQTCSSAGVCACVPSCTGKTCGSDGCGGTCGTCTSPQTCSSAGICACTPVCTGKTCGANGCGGTCGTCLSTQTCSSSGVCAACVPSCTGKTCGSDGCGGTCGTCSSTQTCSTAGVCACTPVCTGKTCGSDGCGGSCGTCLASTATCVSSNCVAVCKPQCTGLNCGDDACGGSCGTCASGLTCSMNQLCTDFGLTTWYASLGVKTDNWLKVDGQGVGTDFLFLHSGATSDALAWPGAAAATSVSVTSVTMYFRTTATDSQFGLLFRVNVGSGAGFIWSPGVGFTFTVFSKGVVVEQGTPIPYTIKIYVWTYMRVTVLDKSFQLYVNEVAVGGPVTYTTADSLLSIPGDVAFYGYNGVLYKRVGIISSTMIRIRFLSCSTADANTITLSAIRTFKLPFSVIVTNDCKTRKRSLDADDAHSQWTEGSSYLVRITGDAFASSEVIVGRLHSQLAPHGVAMDIVQPEEARALFRRRRLNWGAQAHFNGTGEASSQEGDVDRMWEDLLQ